MAGDSFITSTNAIAVITGSFLSGTMASLSLMAVPVMLDTTQDSPQLYQQWARMYHYGHRVLPGLAVTTLMLYSFISLKRRAAKRSWVMFAAAGVVTVAMLPFTWVFMVPTNNLLFDLEARSRVAAVTGVAEAQGLLKTWSLLHLARSLFPLAGAVIGISQL